jgi:hypothetical protein
MMLLTVHIGTAGFRDLFGAVWRPVLAALVMSWAVAWVPVLSNHPLPMLIGKLALCALIYTIAVLALWAAAGRPEGFEHAAVSRFRSMLERQ